MSRTLSLGLFAAAAASLIVFVACGSSSSDTTPPATGGTAGAAGKGGGAGLGGGGSGQGGAQGGAAGDAGQGGTAGGGGGSAGSQGKDCANAIPLKAATETAGSLYPPGTVVYYKADLKKDEWVIIYTTANADDDSNKIDTVVTVQDTNGNMLAEMDDSLPRQSTDTELYYHSPSDQTVCLKVQEWSTWNGDPPAQKSKPNSAFTITWGDPDSTKAPYSLDKEPNNDTASATVANLAEGATPPNSVAYIYGTLDPDTDVDYFAFTMPAGTAESTTYFAPKGLTGWGFSLLPGLTEIVDEQGKVLARLDPSKNDPNYTSPPLRQLRLPLAEGTKAYLKIPRPAGQAMGANDAYFSKHWLTVKVYEPEKEATTGANDTPETAEQMVEYVPSTPNPDVKAYYLVGHLGPATDVDYFKFQGLDGKKTNVECSAIRSGSGLQAPSFTLLKPAAAPEAGADAGAPTQVETETETDLKDVVWSQYPNPAPSKVSPDSAAGDWLFKVSATGQDATVVGNYYYCTIIVLPPYTP
ncbi:MAG: hypothetical protein HY898_34845 [Deltaproteobacteria bacterium]|nr:hypothetical protein [Deltaproteobacteria bacterium]